MLRRTPIFKALSSNIVSSGLQPDVHPLLKILWERAENVVFFAGKVKRRLNDLALFDTTSAANVRGLGQQRASDGVRWAWVATADGKVRRWYGPAAQLIATLTAHQDETNSLPATFFDFVQYGNFTIINNGIETPKIYKPAVPSLTDFGEGLITGAVKLMKKLSFVVAFGTGPRGTGVKWSDSAAIETWTPLSTNSAGGLTIDDFDTRIVTADRLGSASSVYAEDQLGLFTFISAPYYFGQKVALDGIGAVSKNAVCSDGSNNFGVSRNGVWWTDGNTYKYIDEGYLHGYLQEQVNWEQKSKIFSIRNDFTGCFEFFFPMRESVDVNEGWCFDPRTGGWSPLPAVSLKAERRLFEHPLAGGFVGVVSLDSGDDEANALSLCTRPLLMQFQDESGLLDVHMSSRVDEFELLVKAAEFVQVRIGSCDEMLGDYNWDDWQNVRSNSKTYTAVNHIPDGTYWKVEFRSTDSAWDLDLQGFLLFGQIDGTKLTT